MFASPIRLGQHDSLCVPTYPIQCYAMLCYASVSAVSGAVASHPKAHTFLGPQKQLPARLYAQRSHRIGAELRSVWAGCAVGTAAAAAARSLRSPPSSVQNEMRLPSGLWTRLD